MISKTLAEVFQNSYNYSKENNNEIITIEHVFSFLLENERIQNIFRKLEVDYNVMSDEMFKHLEKYKEEMPLTKEPVESMVVNQVIENALKQVLLSGRANLDVEDILVAVMGLEETYCTYLMSKNGITKLRLLEVVSEEGRKYDEDDSTMDDFDSEASYGQVTKRQVEASPKKSVLINLSKAYKGVELEPVIGRDVELQRMVQILSRKKKSNPILVGEAGVGKTSIINGLIELIKQDNVPNNLKDAQVFGLNIGSLTAGTKYRGDFEAKLEGVLKELASYDNPILFIDEIHNMIGAGGTSSSNLDMSEMLKPALADGTIKCIGTTTYSDFKNSFQKNAAISRRFSKVDIKEPSIEDSIKILEGIKPIYEAHHNVVYEPEVVARIVELAQKHLHDKFLPDSAIDLMDEVGSKKHIGLKHSVVIKLKDLDDTISELANIPSKNLDTGNKKLLKNLASNLKKAIFGQDEVIDLVTETVLINKAGLSNPNRPISSFLFTGPTGVGKTELVKELAENLGIKFNRLDMSEYMERHSVSKLIGAAPGYVGYEAGGVLIEMIKKNPHSIVLFDEIEKADPSISNVLLQILDEGSLTDNTGYRADFKNAIIVLTSNLGTKNANKMGFGGLEEGITTKTNDAIKAYFAPEIRNRLDNIVEFNHLSQESILKIVDKNIQELQEQLTKQDVKITFDKKSKQFIADSGYDQSLGARPIQREFNKLVKPGITKAILFGDLVDGGNIKVSLGDGELNFKFEKIKAKEKIEK